MNTSNLSIGMKIRSSPFIPTRHYRAHRAPPRLAAARQMEIPYIFYSIVPFYWGTKSLSRKRDTDERVLFIDFSQDFFMRGISCQIRTLHTRLLPLGLKVGTFV